MKKWLVISSIIFLFFSYPQTLWASASKLQITATTTLMAGIVKEVGRDKVQVTTIIPPASCPGHFDLTIKNVQSLVKADAVFYHGWEPFLNKMSKITAKSKTDLYKIAVSGNWMVPPKQKSATREIAQKLAALDNANKSFYLKNAENYISRIEKEEKKIQNKTKNLRGKTVMVSQQQKPLLMWLGLNPAVVYDGSQKFSPQYTMKLVQQGKAAKVHMVIDNLQNGPQAGRAIANELRVPHITLSNFPGGMKGCETYLKTLEKNSALILKYYR
ncbi:MAG: metal ABC transporter substrate-binding protein [bacterium]